MGQLNGQVTLNDEPSKNRLYRFCEKKIESWVRDRLQNDLTLTAEELLDAEFKVEFTEEEDENGKIGTRQVSCVTEISVRGSHWKGCDLAADSQQAFMHSLKHMHLH